jgi:hypothetical protein
VVGVASQSHLVNDPDDSNTSLGPKTDGFKQERDPNAHSNQDHQKVRPVLSPMVMAGNAVQRIEADLGEAKHHVRRHGQTHRCGVFGNIDGIVAVDHEQGHDPEDAGALEGIVIVIVVRVLFGIGPSMPVKKWEAMSSKLCK